MRKITMEESKQLELEILLDVAACCEKNHLRYFLAYGSLIGAVRHGGFIPWDDDIDIQMPRPDYEKLIEIYNTQRGKEYYELIDPMSRRARHSFVKVVDNRTVKKEVFLDYSNGFLGVDIDVFPLDGCPEDEKKFNKYYKKMINNYTLYNYCNLDPGAKPKFRVVPLIRLLVGDRTARLRYAEKMHARYPYDSSRYVASIAAACDLKESRIEKKYFDEVIYLNFEGHQLAAPAGYDKILTQIYGDYMSPPADTESSHGNSQFWID